MSGPYAHADANDLARTFRSVNARTSRLDGLRNAAALVYMARNDEKSDEWNDRFLANLRAAIAGLIAAERAMPRPIGAITTARPVRKARTPRQPAKVAA